MLAQDPHLIGLGVAIDVTSHQVVVGVHGEIDLVTAPELGSLLAEVLDRGHTNIVLDLSRLQFMDASGIGVIARSSACLEASGGKLTIRSPPTMSRRILALSGLSELIALDDGGASLRQLKTLPRSDKATTRVDSDEDCLTAHPVVINQRTRKVTVSGRPVALTAVELKLLCYFVRRPFNAIDRATLLEVVRGHTIVDGSTITVHVRGLREKIESDPAVPVLIRTIWGLGYAFHPTDPTSDRLAPVVT